MKWLSFSGVSGTGKTTLSFKLGKEVNAYVDTSWEQFVDDVIKDFFFFKLCRFCDRALFQGIATGYLLASSHFYTKLNIDKIISPRSFLDAFTYGVVFGMMSEKEAADMLSRVAKNSAYLCPDTVIFVVPDDPQGFSSWLLKNVKEGHRDWFLKSFIDERDFSEHVVKFNTIFKILIDITGNLNGKTRVYEIPLLPRFSWKKGPDFSRLEESLKPVLWA